MSGDGPLLAGVSYGPFREGQRPGGPNPTADQLREDLALIAPHWGLLRLYSSQAPTEDVLRIIRDDHLPIRVMVGAWIAPDAEGANAAEVESAIWLANTYPEQVVAVCIGNETQVSWSGHRTPPETLVAHLRTARARVRQPVTTADDYNFWNKPESQPIADEIDFIVVHAYAMWNGKSLDEAVAWTADTFAAVSKAHPEHAMWIGETGWATALNPDGNERQHIRAPAGEAEQAKFYDAFTTWARQARVPYFYFEAFDEPWKGSTDPREVEKHWGLFTVDRKPKPALTTLAAPR